MPKLSNCSNEKHNGWWDFEAEIQKELEALDAHDNAQASGSPQVEVVEEKENVNMVDGVADDFKYLIDRFHLQEEKLLHFEKYVLSPRKWPDALLEDSTMETAYPEAGLDSAADSCSSHSCFLTQQYLIRPLYCIDQEENLCLNQERNDKENYYSCEKKEVSKRDLVKEHSTRVMPEVWSVRQMERVKGFSMHDVRKIQGHQRSRTVQKIKDRVLHSLHLNSTESVLNELKLKNSDVKSHRTDFFSDTALMPCQYKGSKAVSIKLGSGTASFDGCQMDALLTRPKGTLTQTLGGKHQQNINETKAAMAEIAKDWGFKEERTALQFLRALNNTRRRAEILTTLKPDAQARLRKFMARSGRHKEISKTVPDTKTLGQR